MKYPAIYRTLEGVDYLYASKDSYYSYTLKCWGESTFTDINEHVNDKNITTEYLANTYGEVLSPKHAEFIVKLAEVNKIQAVNPWREGLLFCFYYNSDGDLILAFYPEKSAKSDGEKQITIPLPPGCESVDEWPKVGDDVQTNFGKGVVELPPDVKGCFVVQVNGGYLQLKRDEFSKPKTPEQELRDELVELTLSHMENKDHPIEANAYYLVSEIIEKYITKKGEGDEL